jgi:hypothetical protein
MSKPVFVETSKGCINLSLVREIVDVEDHHVRFWFDAEHFVELPSNEWVSIRSKMAHLMLWD